jgi:hypothetical protein
MSLSRLLAGLAIIALIAFGLLYLDQHGYFKRASTPSDNGYLKVDEPAPVKPPEPDITLPNPTGAPAATAEASAPGVPVAAITTNTPTGTKIVYIDAQGNPCSPTAVAAAVKPHPHPASTGPSTTSAPAPSQSRRPRRASSSGYPASGYSAPETPTTYAPSSCNLMRTGPNGLRSVALPSGMLMNIAVDRDLGTAISTPGEDFSGYLVGPVTYCGQVILPAGAPVYGSVAVVQTRPRRSEGDAVFQLNLTGLDANGYHFPLQAGSFSRRLPDDPNYSAVAHMNDPNYIENTPVGKDILFPAQSVVSFWLQSPVTVYF